MAPAQPRPLHFRQSSVQNYSTDLVKDSRGWGSRFEHQQSLKEFDCDAITKRLVQPTTPKHSSERSLSSESSNERRRVRFAPKILVKEIASISYDPIISVNPVLSLSESKQPGFTYDICLPLMSNLSAEFSQPATNPPTSFIQLVCELVPWPIAINVPSGVTCSDVLRELYMALQHGVRPDEWETRSPKQREKITQAYMRRCAAIGRGGEKEMEEKLRGIRRVDWLMRQTMFIGLSPSYDRDHTWVLTLGRH